MLISNSKFGDDTALFVAGPYVWKSLPESLTSTDYNTNFEHHLKLHFLANIFDFISLYFTDFNCQAGLARSRPGNN